MQVTVDPTELLFRLVLGGRAPAKYHRPAVPVLDVAAEVTTDLDQRLDGIVDRSVLASVGATPGRVAVNVSAKPSRSEAGSTGVVVCKEVLY
jgi:hypothetical protein